MIHPIPPGTRDVLPDEMRELRRLQMALLDVFESFEYSEVRTPTIEYADVVDRGDELDAGAYRFFDDRGELLALRTDMTIPIARLVATRFGEVEPPYRLSYMANSYKAVTPQRAQMREFGQAGIELIGVNGTAGTAEVVEVLTRSLDAVGLPKAVIGLGDADLWSCLLTDFSAGPELIKSTAARLASHDIVGLEIELESSGDLSGEQIGCLTKLIRLRGGPEVIGEARGMGGAAFETSLDSLQATYDAIAERGGADRVQVDLGLLRDLGYYSGSILEVYDPSVGEVIGGGGRYDGLMAKFEVDQPAAGFTLYVERIHKAQLEQGRNDV
ncbi:MAG TPA: ATP phosphoribosyltransferase regulatory subunit [Solirubrobacterales bacterium]|nr:ATP phosphoribosyltransferase regulatory subunit [Solirubrobacterales bacterium]